MKNKKLLIGDSLIAMLTTGAAGVVTPIQNASAHDITANYASTQYTVSDIQIATAKTNYEGETSTTTTQSNVQETSNSQVSSSSKGAAIYQAALKSVGINYHDWPAGYMNLGTIVSASEAQPGDLIYYANCGMGVAHIAVYAGNGQAIHGGWLGNQTVVNSADIGSGAVYIRVK